MRTGYAIRTIPAAALLVGMRVLDNLQGCRGGTITGITPREDGCLGFEFGDGTKGSCGALAQIEIEEPYTVWSLEDAKAMLARYGYTRDEIESVALRSWTHKEYDAQQLVSIHETLAERIPT
jgi:hypothetical protein